MKFLLLANKKFVVVTLILVALSSVTATITPVLLQLFSVGKQGMNLRLFGVVLGAMALSFGLQFALLIYRENYAARFNTRYLSSLLGKIHRLNYDAYAKSEPAYLINRMFAVVDSLYLFMVSGFGEFIRSLLILAVALVLAFSIHWTIFLTLLILIPVNVVGFRWINRRLRVRMEEMQKRGAAASKDLVSALSNVDAVKQLPDASSLDRLLLPGIREMYRTLAQTNKFAQGSSSSLDFVNQFCQNALYLGVTYAIAQNLLPIGSVVVVGLLLPLFFSALGGLTQVNLKFKTLETGLDFVRSELDAHAEQDGSIEVDRIRSITLEDPEFELDGRIFRYRLQDRLLPGQIVHVQGASGSGKSSLLKLLLAFREAKGVAVNDIPIASLRKNGLRARIAYASQHPVILSKSLEENIGWGRRLSDEEKARLERSKVLAPILRTKTWETRLTENGANLSGGEKQRIAAARLLLQDADVLLLDESTSSIDAESADDIFRTLIEAAPGKIVLYTSHNRDAAEYATHTLIIETESRHDDLLDDRRFGEKTSSHDAHDPQLPEIR
ncbi:peptidase [Saccharibacillus sp. O23]|uniref:ATP-binding cassette domain-containing protein n=1 Tax=Saccharibacillus sp. O23 TaxID=2009338 RepID=UPI000B4E3531|nr:ABC transporter ATP-binding protein [Saccharibacillus sp. O23]OWR32363.1 peptidase [Saccharibacillus sp. O23]